MFVRINNKTIDLVDISTEEGEVIVEALQFFYDSITTMMKATPDERATAAKNAADINGEPFPFSYQEAIRQHSDEHVVEYYGEKYGEAQLLLEILTSLPDRRRPND